MEEMIQENKRLQKALDDTTKALETEKSRKKIWKYLTIITVWIFAGIALYETKLQIVWQPVSDSPQMCVIMSDWWGLKVQTVYPIWRKPTDETREYSENWCIAYPDNTWRVFYAGTDAAFFSTAAFNGAITADSRTYAFIVANGFAAAPIGQMVYEPTAAGIMNVSA